MWQTRAVPQTGADVKNNFTQFEPPYLKEINIAPGSSNNWFQASGAKNEGSYTVANLYEFVKTNDKNFNPKPSSKQGGVLDLAKYGLNTTVQSAWASDFPEVVGHLDIKSLREYNGYTEAKGGSREAATSVVTQAISDGGIDVDKVAELGRNYPNAILVPVHAEEADGKNQLPYAYARAIAKITGQKLTTDIVQTNKAGHTGANGLTRFVNRTMFKGDVIRGAEYLIVDDMIVQGGAVNDLRKYIESQGGRVVAATTLATGTNSIVLPIQAKTLKAIKDRFGKNETDKFLEELNISGGVSGLTESEGKYLLRFETLDRIRNTIAEGGFEKSFSGGEIGYYPEDADIEGDTAETTNYYSGRGGNPGRIGDDTQYSIGDDVDFSTVEWNFAPEETLAREAELMEKAKDGTLTQAEEFELDGIYLDLMDYDTKEDYDRLMAGRTLPDLSYEEEDRLKQLQYDNSQRGLEADEYEEWAALTERAEEMAFFSKFRERAKADLNIMKEYTHNGITYTGDGADLAKAYFEAADTKKALKQLEKASAEAIQSVGGVLNTKIYDNSFEKQVRNNIRKSLKALGVPMSYSINVKTGMREWQLEELTQIAIEYMRDNAAGGTQRGIDMMERVGKMANGWVNVPGDDECIFPQACFNPRRPRGRRPRSQHN